jgi:hypothetical protein
MTGQFHTPAALLLGKSPWYPLGKRLGEPQNQPGCCGEEKKVTALARNQTPVLQLVVVTILIELPHLTNNV